MSEFSPVSFDLTDVDLERQTAALELLDGAGVYFEIVDGALIVPERHAADVAAALYPNDPGGAPRWIV